MLASRDTRISGAEPRNAGLVGARRGRGEIDAKEAGAQLDVVSEHHALQRGHVAEDRRFLKRPDDAERRGDVRLQAGDRPAFEYDAPARRRERRADDLEKRALASAVGTDDREDFAGLDGRN